MSVLFENPGAVVLGMENYLNSIVPEEPPLKVNGDLFEILSPYTFRGAAKTQKPPSDGLPPEIYEIRTNYQKLLPVLREQGVVKELQGDLVKNTRALSTAELVYENSGKCPVKEVSGGNWGPASVQTIQGSKYVFPENCQFFCKDIGGVGDALGDRQFDLVLLDPPWWNKYIRRKRKRSHAYDMMYNCDLKAIPIKELLNEGGLVAVWCTNSTQHLNYLKEELFPKWQAKLLATWHWMKVTVHGEPVCEFSKPPGEFR